MYCMHGVTAGLSTAGIFMEVGASGWKECDIIGKMVAYIYFQWRPWVLSIIYGIWS